MSQLPIFRAEISDKLDQKGREELHGKVMATKGVLSAAFDEVAKGKYELLITRLPGTDAEQQVSALPGVTAIGPLNRKLPPNF